MLVAVLPLLLCPSLHRTLDALSFPRHLLFPCSWHAQEKKKQIEIQQGCRVNSCDPFLSSNFFFVFDQVKFILYSRKEETRASQERRQHHTYRKEGTRCKKGFFLFLSLVAEVLWVFLWVAFYIRRRVQEHRHGGNLNNNNT